MLVIELKLYCTWNIPLMDQKMNVGFFQQLSFVPSGHRLQKWNISFVSKETSRPFLVIDWSRETIQEPGNRRCWNCSHGARLYKSQVRFIVILFITGQVSENEILIFLNHGPACNKIARQLALYVSKQHIHTVNLKPVYIKSSTH